MTEPTPPNYKDTLNLPKTNFDMKANLTQREPAMLKQWQDQNLYQQIRAARKGSGKGKWTLHDGPPYANGDIHIGHLVNKVLKDIIIKFRTMQGFDSPYVPGWDCHGLPIESAIQKDLGPKFRELTKEEVRKKCADYAMKYVKLQGDSFQRLGILGEFNNPYLTLNPHYESGILEVLAELVKRDLVYRQKKPVHWCTNDRTALAEAELEYANCKDNSIYVMFENVGRMPLVWRMWAESAKLGGEYGVAGPSYFMIWTTTPWTLPANRAIAVHPDHKYVAVAFKKDERKMLVIVAEQLIEKVMAAGGITEYVRSNGISGGEWVKYAPTYKHPLDPSRLQPVVLADYVTLEDGTGLVHTAPGHGKEDYQTGLKYNLEIYNPVLPDGRYDDSVPDFLKGKSIWDANDLVLQKLTENGTLFHAQKFDHEYPHCWRCKKPVIFRATEQWFVKASGGELTPAQLTAALASPIDPEGKRYDETLEKSTLWRNAVKFSYQVKFIPEWGQNRLQGMLATRPDWCISRQRSWGVPIPAFFDDKGNLLLTEKSTRRIAAHFAEHGADSWYTQTPQQLLGADEWEDTWITPSGQIENRKSKIENTWHKGADILDVWFESGASHHAVLERTHPELGYPATMYLEGSDQHRGWFQSSLLEAAGYKELPPFEQLLTHGFVVDEKGMKYSKSSGNYVPVETLLKQHGADVLRLWVSSVDYQNDIRFGSALLASVSDAYRKIRNTIRYLLGNLYDFDYTKDAVELHPNSIDSWMLGSAVRAFGGAFSAYERYEFHVVFKLIYEFCNVDISAMYAKAIKDRLYCELPSSRKRRASQTVCHRMLIEMVKLLAPILVFTSEEAWAEIRKLQGGSALPESIHLAPIERMDRSLSHLHTHWQDTLLPLIEKGNKQLDDLKRTIGLGNPLDAEAVIVLPAVEDNVAKLMDFYGPEIEDALGVGFHRIEHGEIWDIKINDTRTLYPSCARSWKRRPDVGSDPAYPDLSARDAAVVKALRS